MQSEGKGGKQTNKGTYRRQELPLWQRAAGSSAMAMQRCKTNPNHNTPRRMNGKRWNKGRQFKKRKREKCQCIIKTTAILTMSINGGGDRTQRGIWLVRRTTRFRTRRFEARSWVYYSNHEINMIRGCFFLIFQLDSLVVKTVMSRLLCSMMGLIVLTTGSETHGRAETCSSAAGFGCLRKTAGLPPHSHSNINTLGWLLGDADVFRKHHFGRVWHHYEHDPEHGADKLSHLWSLPLAAHYVEQSTEPDHPCSCLLFLSPPPFHSQYPRCN